MRFEIASRFWAFGIIGTLSAAAGCTDLLGDFTVGNLDGAMDGPDGASPSDASQPADVGPEGEAGGDAGRDGNDASDGNDAGDGGDARGDGSDAGDSGCLAEQVDPTQLFVVAGGSGAACTMAAPCGTIQQALDLAPTVAKTIVYVGASTQPYVEALTLASAVTIEGGWSVVAGTWAQTCSSGAVVVQAPPTSNTTLLADDIGGTATLRTLTLKSKAAADVQPGESIYGVSAKSVNQTTAVLLDGVEVSVVAGGPGATGSAGAQGAMGSGTCTIVGDGGNGSPGDPGTGGTVGTFGASGFTPGSSGTTGATGGAANDGTAGGQGSSNPNCADSCSPPPPAACGACAIGSYATATADPGYPGYPGCPGAPGGGGGPGYGGGASVAIYSWGATVTVQNGSLTAGDGGQGGNGGIGGSGGTGIQGAAGQASACATTCVCENGWEGTACYTDGIVPISGGNGGAPGGTGGLGGQGGGGAGGWSCTTFAHGTGANGVAGTVTQSGASMVHGTAGAAGQPGGAAGEASYVCP
jgi:hypothetical protein